MRIRLFWRDCDQLGRDHPDRPLDALWVEASLQEAEETVYPLLSQDAVSKSRELAGRFQDMARRVGNPALPYCFLVAKDLSSINPFPPHYPVHQLWNAYSPFEPIPEVAVASLDELRELELPSKETT